MNLKYPILLAFFAIFLFAGCKKEEGEKKISLRTKKSRLTGDWRLAKGRATISTTGYSESYTFDGSNATINGIYKVKYSLSLKINKDGTFYFKDFIDMATLEASGTWNFNTGVGEAKRKEEVVFFIDNIQNGYTHGYNIFNRNSTNFVYKIEELSSKKMKISSSGRVFANEYGDYITFSTSYEMTQ